MEYTEFKTHVIAALNREFEATGHIEYDAKLVENEMAQLWAADKDGAYLNLAIMRVQFYVFGLYFND